MPSDFTSATPGSAYWQSGTDVCRSTGRSVLADLRVGLALESLTERDLADSETEARATAEAGAASAAGWTPQVLANLATLLRRYGHSVPSGMSTDTVRAILWGAYNAAARRRQEDNTIVGYAHVGSPADYAVPADTILPVVGSVPPLALDGSQGGYTCTPVSAPPQAPPVRGLSVAKINPALVLLLLVGLAIGAAVIGEATKRKEGSSW